MKRKTKKATPRSAGVAVDLRATGAGDSRARGAGGDDENAPSPGPGGHGLPGKADATEPAAGTAAATKRRSHREAQLAYWADVRSGKRIRNENPPPLPRGKDFNPLLAMPEEERARLFDMMRDCPYNDQIRARLRAEGRPEPSNPQLDEFRDEEADHYWEKRAAHSAIEANALVNFVERTKPKFSAGIREALGQQTFTMVARGDCEPGAITRLTTAYYRARNDERADQMQGLRRRQLEVELQGHINLALDKFAEECAQHPAAQEAFEALRRELLGTAEDDA